ncbi:MAG TPA: AAA family ATPase, partial [Polyangiales bacterium]|nr:AAA family ATPase [Polyangiales bacterium]
MLYEMLTGELPFEGAVYELLRNKLERDPRPPLELDATIPAHLSALCMELLARDPNARPKGSDVLARLVPPNKQASLSLPAFGDTTLQTDTESQDSQRGFFGRKPELAALWDALHDADRGRTIVAHVRGISGAGKSALVEQFLDEVEHEIVPVGRPEALVLRSRCYEREAMPFKALDGVIDALSRHLAHANDFEVSNLLPTDIAALAQIFPVLERLRAVQHLLSSRACNGDAVDNRQRAEAALRELFSRLAARRPVVIWIDDLQWGDLDSAGILKGWLQRGAPLPLLLVISYRSDEAETSECLRSFLGSDGDQTAIATRRVDVTALAREDVHALCRHQLAGRADAALIERIVRESQGSPFLAAQLSALAEAKLARGDADVQAISIGDLVTQTKSLLPGEARYLLRILAVAGRPIAPKLALRAAGLRRGGRELVHALRRLQLVRTREVAGEGLLEVYHDRVRENVQRLLGPAESEQIHGNLLEALEYSGGRVDPDWLHTLAIGANQRVAAYRYGLAAAERAMTTLAFERAVELYTRCIELSDAPEPQRSGLVRKLAQALDCAGRGSEAADAYLQAAQAATGPDAVALLRLGTSHLLRSGRFEEGESMLQRVLAAMDMRVPRTQVGLLATIVWERLRNTLRGLRYTLRSEAELPAAQLARIDAYTALRHETLAIDPLRAALFHARGMRLALDAGEAMNILQGLSGMCHLLSLEGGARAERRTDQLL